MSLERGDGVLFLTLSIYFYLSTWVQSCKVLCLTLYCTFKFHLAQKCLTLFKYFKMTIFLCCPSKCVLGYKEDLKLPSKDSFQLIWNRNCCLLLIFIEAQIRKSPWTFLVFFSRICAYSNLASCSLEGCVTDSCFQVVGFFLFCFQYFGTQNFYPFLIFQLSIFKRGTIFSYIYILFKCV